MHNAHESDNHSNQTRLFPIPCDQYRCKPKVAPIVAKIKYVMYRKDRVKGEEAISVAIAMLGEPGFSRKKSSPEKGPTLRQRSVAAGTKNPERYYDHKSKGFKVR